VQSETYRYRIGELSRRVGVSPELLRAWERRYGLLEPVRSPGGFRLYSNEDERRVKAMQRHLERGLSAAQAAESVIGGGPDPETPPTAQVELRAELQNALLAYDEAEAHRVLDRLLAVFGIETALVEVVLPVLRSLGDGWAEGSVTIAQEHFATNVLRGRLLAIARDWGRGTGPLAVLACPPGEQHDLPLLIFGIALRQSGWRIRFLGADTPIATIDTAATAVRSRAVVLSAAVDRHLNAVEQELAPLARRTTIAIGGPGASARLAQQLGAVLLHGDPVAAAAAFALGGDSEP
jgi:DNA-binding transcriptional MerR regulator